MLKAVSTYLFVKERLHPGILDGLARSGVQAVEIFAARQHLDYANRKQHVKEIAEWFRGSGIPLNSVHSPLYADYEWGRAGAPPVNIASTDRAGRSRCHGRDQARSRNRRADSVSLSDAALGVSQRRFQREGIRGRDDFHRASAGLRQAARACAFCWKTFPTNFPPPTAWWK